MADKLDTDAHEWGCPPLRSLRRDLRYAPRSG